MLLWKASRLSRCTQGPAHTIHIPTCEPSGLPSPSAATLPVMCMPLKQSFYSITKRLTQQVRAKNYFLPPTLASCPKCSTWKAPAHPAEPTWNASESPLSTLPDMLTLLIGQKMWWLRKWALEQMCSIHWSYYLSATWTLTRYLLFNAVVIWKIGYGSSSFVWLPGRSERENFKMCSAQSLTLVHAH